MTSNKRLLSPLWGWDSQKRCAYFACPKGGRYFLGQGAFYRVFC